MDGLRRRVESLRFHHENFEGSSFISEADLFDLFSPSTVKDCLETLGVPVHEIRDLRADIIQGGRKCLAILILGDSGDAISCFFKRDSMQRSSPDSRLPYNSKTLEEIFGVDEESPLVKGFLKWQWEFAVPILHENMISRELGTRIILPFLQEEPAGRGSMGIAWRVKIHPQFHKLPLKDDMVIRKEIICQKPNDATGFRKELENLSLLAHLKHPNKVRLYCSYSYRKRHNLIFAVAEGGSLADYLGGKSSIGELEGSQVLLALADLASALDAVHNFESEVMDLSLSGCHHDLAPRNIFIHGDTFLLADFGLSAFKNVDEDSLTNFKTVHGSYVAPESQMVDGDRILSAKTSRSSDIWSFGCILSEVLTHMLRGSAGVGEFFETRRVDVTPEIKWSRFHIGPKTPNPAVGLWLEGLRANEEPFCVRLVDLITEMLSLGPTKRPRSGAVVKVLRSIYVLSLANRIGSSLRKLYEAHPSTAYMLSQMRLESWSFAFDQLVESSKDIHGEIPGLDFQKITEAMKEISRILEDDKEKTPSLRQQQQSVIGYQQGKLREALPPHYQSVDNAQLAKLVLTKDEVDQLGQLSTAVTEAGHDDVGVLVAIKHITALAEAGRLIEKKNLLIDHKSIELKEDVDIHRVAVLSSTSERVFVEWLRYNEQWADPAINTELRNRLTSVAGLLHAESTSRIHGTLHCKGVFHDLSEKAFGVAYSLPEPGTRVITLHGLLSAERGRYRPLLEYRFQLALDICQCIHTFHQVGWLHRSLHSMNVVFFPPETAANTEWAKGPRIIGFAGGRQSQLDAFSLGPTESAELWRYQHPEYFESRERYREEYDYYSVGILLLEIGLWSPLDKILQSKRFLNKSLKEIGSELVAARVPELGVSMGKRYTEATRMCLDGSFAGQSREACCAAFKERVLDQIPRII